MAGQTRLPTMGLHEVVGLPVAHNELNLIEMVWSQVEEYVMDHNHLFTTTEVERLAHEGFKIVISGK